MSGVSASHLIIFIASIVVAAGVAGTLVTQVDRVGTSIADQNEDIEGQIDADIRIISDTGSPGSIYNETEDELTVYVKNTGETELRPDPDSVDVLIEGSFVAPTGVERVDDPDSDRWTPGSVVEITVDTSETTIDGDTRVTVAIRDNEDTIRFNANA